MKVVNLLAPLPLSEAEKTAGDAVSVYALAGKLFLTANGHLLLSVPNALARGVFDALHEPGVELPLKDGVLNAHITVAHRDELAAAGVDPSKCSERGHTFRYNLGRLKTAQPTSWAEMSRVWFLEVKSPELEQFRKSYGLSARPRNNDHEFHVTVAVRRRRVLLSGDVVKRSENYHEKIIDAEPADDKSAALADDVAAAGRLTATDPTPAQRESGNYKKGKVSLHGLTVAIENPKGSTRSGTSKSGKAWSSRMKHHYGYILGTEDKSNDDDHVDVFIGDQPESEIVFVVNQVDPETKKFDEVKVMLGFVSEAAAREGYLANYEKDWQGLESIRPLTMAHFKEWLADIETKQADASRLAKLASNIFQRSMLAQLSNPQWDPGRGVVSNAMTNVQQFRRRGQEMVQHADFADSLQGTIDPEYAWQRLRDQFAGRHEPRISPEERLVFDAP